ncbi:MAG: YggT family protein [Eubacteriales bacterium]|jgi:YggT family protein|nr:YggT family protein [Eubacteriales bacterium]
MIIKRAVDILLTVIEVLVFLRVIISWLPVSRENPLVRFLYLITEPILGPIRSLIQKSSFGANIMFDLSPIVVWLIIRVIRMMY